MGSQAPRGSDRRFLRGESQSSHGVWGNRTSFTSSYTFGCRGVKFANSSEKKKQWENKEIEGNLRFDFFPKKQVLVFENTPSLTSQHDIIQSHLLSFPIVFKTKTFKTVELFKLLLLFEKALRHSQEFQRNCKNQKNEN